MESSLINDNDIKDKLEGLIARSQILFSNVNPYIPSALPAR